MSQNTGRLLKKAANQLTKNFDHFASQLGLTGTQMSIIDYLSRHPHEEVRQKDIEVEFNIQRSTATVILQRMEHKQLLTRRLATVDARQKAIELTANTTHLTAVINTYMSKQQQNLANHFSLAEIKTFETILTYYLNTIESERPTNEH